MVKRKNGLNGFLVMFFLLGFLCLGYLSGGIQDETEINQIADISYGSTGITFRPKVTYSSLILSVSSPDGAVNQKTFNSGNTPYYQLSGDVLNGSYTYELRLIPLPSRLVREDPEDPGKKGFLKDKPTYQKPLIQSGGFFVQGGRIVTSDATDEEPMVSVQDQVILDDLIVDGSLAVGFDAVNGESFGFDTIRLKENNLRIHFDDTSSSASFPNNDWRIVINDSANGGANYFSILDATASRRSFTLEAGAPAHSLYVDDYGRVGLGTSTPSLELHISDGDTPSVRLDQNGSSGWTPQSWDVAGNETNFFIRDVTNGSKLPFRIQPNAPGDSITIKNNGLVGMGTWSPDSELEIEGTNKNVRLRIDRTDGADFSVNVTAQATRFGTASNYPLRFITNANNYMTLSANGNLGIGVEPTNNIIAVNGGAYCNGGAWVDGSSIEYKENIEDLTTDEAMEALEDLNPVKFNYKQMKEEQHVGFIAEDVHELVAQNDRKGLSPMDIVAVLTKVVKEQQKTIDDLQNMVIKQQQKTIDDLQKKIKEMERKIEKE